MGGRSRQGIGLFVPPGDESGPTRAAVFFNDTYELLTALGVADV
jgi:hypothetical protein